MTTDVNHRLVQLRAGLLGGRGPGASADESPVTPAIARCIGGVPASRERTLSSGRPTSPEVGCPSANAVHLDRAFWLIVGALGAAAAEGCASSCGSRPRPGDNTMTVIADPLDAVASPANRKA